ncbi:MAG TPA: zinc-binding dehydrogenase [Nocardioides sp.]|nr:zinc-binding dehydrogenase [Nocardioides sp.]
MNAVSSAPETLPDTVLAAVSDGHGATEVREVPLPAYGSLLKVESSALCGTDVDLHEGKLKAPAVLGHHVIGHVVRLTDEDAARLKVKVGDRVAVEEYVGCGGCADCKAGDYRLCATVDLWTGGERVGMIPADRASGLHGGNAGYMELTSRHALHRLPDDLEPDIAAWTLPLANAVDWTLVHGEVRRGSKVAIIGPGYHGLACVAAAVAAGAADIRVLGRARNAQRLAYAEALGAIAEVNDETVVDRITGEIGLLDTVVDTIGTPDTIATAAALLRRGGVLVLAGLAGGSAGIDLSQVVRKTLTVRGVRGRAPEAVRRAIDILSEEELPLEAVPSHHIPLDRVGETLHALAEGTGPESPHIVINPWLPVDTAAVVASLEVAR